MPDDNTKNTVELTDVELTDEEYCELCANLTDDIQRVLLDTPIDACLSTLSALAAVAAADLHMPLSSLLAAMRLTYEARLEQLKGGTTSGISSPIVVDNPSTHPTLRHFHSHKSKEIH